MASAFNGGSKSSPKWVARFKDNTGKWRSKVTSQGTRREALKVAHALEAQGERVRLGVERAEVTSPVCGKLMEAWSMSLTNRSAHGDVGRLRLHVLPRFKALKVEDVTLAELMRWLDAMASAGTSGATARHCLGLVSRFFAWAVARGHATSNPVRSVPAGARPKQSAKDTNVPWIEDDAVVMRLMETLPDPFRLMFYVGNRSGLRLGEICGLRLTDVDTIGEGAIRVRFSYNGPLKEDKTGGKVKWAPAPADAESVLGPWIARRRAEGAGDEDFLFARKDGGHFAKEAVEAPWERARDALGLGGLTFYQATRHSFASRNLSRGVPLDEVASALGHSTPAITARHYAHFVRKSFSTAMTTAIARAPLSLVA